MRFRLSCTLALVPAIAAAQSRHEIIRGHITTDSGRAVAAATVQSLRAPDRARKLATTDASGAFVIDWPDGTGEYLMTVVAPGLPATSRRITRQGADSVLVFDLLLTNRPRAQQLAAVVSQAQR